MSVLLAAVISAGRAILKSCELICSSWCCLFLWYIVLTQFKQLF